ncbi:MAG: hypothetical protein MR534_07385, partial [Prevotellaceae bacterium]|nr:hypothetical protein [Prevotellaceae bacterium]
MFHLIIVTCSISIVSLSFYKEKQHPRPLDSDTIGEQAVFSGYHLAFPLNQNLYEKNRRCLFVRLAICFFARPVLYKRGGKTCLSGSFTLFLFSPTASVQSSVA